MEIKTRRLLMEAMEKRYRLASRAQKSWILDEVCELTGYHRKSAIRRIRRVEDCRLRPPARRKRRPRYGPPVLAVVEKVWVEAGYPWSVRLKAILELWRPWIRVRYPLPARQEALLWRISPRTIDRVLQDKKRGLRRRLYGRTKPGTLLRHRIPIRCEHWDVKTPGHLELDTLSHSGECAEGLFAYSFNLTDIGSTWVETRSVLGKGAQGICEALEEMRLALPFPIQSIDSDNGSEFLNAPMVAYCDQRNISATRSRPSKKDDNAHIEQKNWTHVRKLIGWDRYETLEAVRAMNDLYAQELREYMNLFQPSVKLIRTIRKGSRRTRHYDRPLTPLDRLAEMPEVDPARVEALLARRRQLNPFTLAAIIRRKLERIWSLRQTRGNSPAKTQVTSEKEIARALSRALSNPPAG